MAIRVTHETNPALLGQGAYAGGRAQYDRQREQLALQYAAMQNQANQAAANRAAQVQSQARAAQNAQQQMLLGAHLQQQERGQFQQDIMQRIDAESELQRQQQQFATDQKIRLSQSAYDMKKAEYDSQISFIKKAPWDDATKQSAIEQATLGFSQYDVQPEPTFEDRLAQTTKDYGRYVAYTDSKGDTRYFEKPDERIGTHEARMIGDREIPGQWTKDGWEPYDPDALKAPDQAKEQAEARKQLVASRDKARKFVMDTMPPYVVNPQTNEPTGEIDLVRLEEMVTQAVAAEEQAISQALGMPQQQGEQQQLPPPQATEPQQQPAPQQTMPPELEEQFTQAAAAAAAEGDERKVEAITVLKETFHIPKAQMTPLQLKAREEAEAILRKKNPVKEQGWSDWLKGTAVNVGAATVGPGFTTVPQMFQTGQRAFQQR